MRLDSKRMLLMFGSFVAANIIGLLLRLRCFASLAIN